MASTTIVLLLGLVLLPASTVSLSLFNPEHRNVCEEVCQEDEFCGLDGRCHAYSCEAWYKQGHPFFTNYDASTSEDLSCYMFQESERSDRKFRDIQPMCPRARPTAIQYFKFSSSPVCPVKGVPGIQYARKCTALPSQNMAFVCYDMLGNNGLEADGLLRKYRNATEDAEGDDIRFQLFIQAPSHSYDSSVTSLETSMMSSLVRSKSNDESVFEFCDPGCWEGEFCGSDGQCHLFDCPSLFSFGPEYLAGALVGNTTPSDSDLQCEIRAQTAPTDDYITNSSVCGDVWPVAVEHHCARRNNFSPNHVHLCPSFTNNPTLSFTRRCVGQRNPSQSFVCYDMKELNTTELEAYQELTGKHLDTDCDSASLSPPCSEIEIDEFYSWNSCITTRHSVTHKLLQSGISGRFFAGPPQLYSTEDFSLQSIHRALFLTLDGDRPPLETDSGELSGRGNGGGCLLWLLVFAIASSHIVILV